MTLSIKDKIPVFVIFKDTFQGDSVFVGVYSTKDIAEKALNKRIKSYHLLAPRHYIEESYLDSI